MEFSSFQPSSRPLYFNSPFLFPSNVTPENNVHWTETPESHIYTSDLQGVRKEDIRVEVEDNLYLIIRTEEAITNSPTGPNDTRSFMRKFRLPGMVDLAGISAGYEDGVLTVTVPRQYARRVVRIDPADLPERHEILAPAA